MPDINDLNPDFKQKLESLIAASHGKIWITSGFRSHDLQSQLYSQAVKKYGEERAGQWVAAPGHSNHERGLAADLGGDLALAHRLAPEFGLTFPMSWEKWHIEPAGLRGSNPQAYTAPPADHQGQQDVAGGDPHSLAGQLQNFMGILSGSGASTNPYFGAPGSTSSSLDGTASGLASSQPLDPNAGSTLGSGDVDKFLAATRQHESGGNYAAANSAGAYGAYQYIQSTWDSIARLAGRSDLVGVRPDHASPQDQDAVARFNAERNYQQYGDWAKVAASWYYPAWAGDPSKWDQVPMPGAGNTLTVRQYADYITSHMQ